IDYVATDRRVVLDRMLESTVFTFPEVTIEWPKKVEAPIRPPKATRGPRRRRTKRVDVEPEVEAAEEMASEAEEEQTPAAVRLRQLREQARSLENIVAEGGVDDPGVWGDLGYLKHALDETDEALTCQVAEVFYSGATRPDTQVKALFHASAKVVGVPPSAEGVLELAVRDRRSSDELVLLGTGVLAAIEGQLKVPDDVIQLVVPTYADPRTPVPRRLAWSILEAFYRRRGDRLGMTRAKEAIVGGVNSRGLSELHDLPRFVRYALAMADGPGEGGGAQNVRNYVTALESLLGAVEGQGFEEIDVFACYARIIFAVGFMRLGEKKSALELVAPVEYELDVHERPNQLLFRLYLARMAHVGAGGSPGAWASEVQKLLSPIRDPKVLRVVHWLRKRSVWLQIPDDKAAPVRVRPALARTFERLRKRRGDIATTLAESLRARAYYDYELTEAVEHGIGQAMASGSEAMIRDVLAVAVGGLGNIEILGHRAQAIGSCLRAASLLSDEVTVERLLDSLIDLANDRQLASVKDLLKAVHPALMALRRFGEIASARRLLEALEGVKTYSRFGDLQLLASIAAGRMQLGDGRQADLIVDSSINRVLKPGTDYVGRYEAAAAIIHILR
ncbi:MAG: hypothetical protein ACPG4T_21750, partial [Nannocystaceae bacterium]